MGLYQDIKKLTREITNWYENTNLYASRGALYKGEPYNISKETMILEKIKEILDREGMNAFVRWYFSESMLQPKDGFMLNPDYKCIKILTRDLMRVTKKYSDDLVKFIVQTMAIVDNTFDVKEKHYHNRVSYRSTINGKVYVHTLSTEKNDSLRQRYRGSNYSHDCFSMLHRYNLFSGGGYQGTLPLSMFGLLVEHFNTTTECFASPINVTLEKYYSAFIDIDSPFGSLGDFFASDITEGSYEANPPFTEEAIQMFSEKLDDIFDHSNKPLSFVVIYPAWDDAVGHMNLAKHKYLRFRMHLKPKKHAYRGIYITNFSSTLFIIQNPAGNKKWPVVDNLQSLIFKNFI